MDLTVPEIEFFDIWDHSANSGVVAPGIRYHDRNYDIKGIELELTGYQNGSVKMKYSQNEIQQGMELKLEDFAHLPEMDDLYILKAVVYDPCRMCILDLRYFGLPQIPANQVIP